MSRRIVWGGLAVLVFTVLLGLWLSTRFEQVPVDRWTPPGKEARRDDYLAMGRFLQTMGRPLHRAAGAEQLDHLAPGSVLLLDKQRRTHLTPARTQHLLDWVKQGGYLIVAGEASGIKDPLLEFFQVNCGCNVSAKGHPRDAEDNTLVPDPEAATKKASQAPESIAVTIPGAARALQVDFAYSHLALGEIEPEWRAGATGFSEQILHFRHGAGHVTVLASLDRLFDNRHIGHRDHAELLWTLLQTYQPDRSRPLILMTRVSRLSLWTWLSREALPAMLAAAVLIGLWLWSVVPRFGQTLPVAPPARRELREHLAAIGRYVWRVGGLDFWLQTARESCRERLAVRHPGLLDLAPEDQARALADLTQRPVGLIAAALFQPAATPQAFTQALRTLRNLERTL